MEREEELSRRQHHAVAPGDHRRSADLLESLKHVGALVSEEGLCGQLNKYVVGVGGPLRCGLAAQFDGSGKLCPRRVCELRFHGTEGVLVKLLPKLSFERSVRGRRAEVGADDDDRYPLSSGITDDGEHLLAKLAWGMLLVERLRFDDHPRIIAVD
jgi:hypothetical protein